MKLWQKISLICGGILISIVALCSALLLTMAKETLLASAYERAETRQHEVVSAFTKEADLHALKSDSDSVQRALMQYCFAQVGESRAALIVNGETVFSQLPFAPEEYATPGDNGQRAEYIGKINGREYYITASKTHIANFPDKECRVYFAEDISPIHESIRAMTGVFALVGLAFSAVGVGLIILLVRRSMTPLLKLQATAGSIAAGNYAERAQIAAPDEIGALAESFNHMAECVQRHITALTETAERQKLFIGAVTHEFKTPLTAILLSADTLQNTYMTESEQLAALQGIEAQGRWLERLVQKMLKLLTIDREIELHEFPAATLAERVRESTESPLRERGIGLTVDCTAETLCGDIDLLQSAVVNLVDNAGKASEPGQTVHVTISESAIEVTDSGKGISPAALEHIKEPFFTADKSRSKKLGGVGLGLALADEIARSHGARLEIESEEGRGTRAKIIKR